MTLQERKTLSNSRHILSALIGIAIFCSAGCSTAKPASEAQPQKAEAAAKSLAKAPVSQSSSLEQLQQGKVVGTAPSSPLKDIYFDFDRYDLGADARTQARADLAGTPRCEPIERKGSLQLGIQSGGLLPSAASEREKHLPAG